jgi:magnesium-transporting ATPase (P-type)
VSLDGETNLKIRKALPDTLKLNEEEVLSLEGRIECEQPNESIYTFTGRIFYKGEPKPISKDQILLRGSRLKTVDYVYGVVIFTGYETKLMKNANRAPVKISNMEKQTNTCVFGLFITQLIISVICATSYTIFGSLTQSNYWYLYAYVNQNGATFFFEGI